MKDMPLKCKLLRCPTGALAVAVAIALSLGACATDTTSRVGNAAATPLSDLNVVRAEIPAVLAQAQKEAYALPAESNCEALAAEIRKLDEVLGADLDAPPSASDPGLVERGADVAGDTAIGALQRTAEGIVPFRGWIRKLSGAERYSKRVSAAISAGIIRRAFLKGIGVSHGCSWNSHAA